MFSTLSRTVMSTAVAAGLIMNAADALAQPDRRGANADELAYRSMFSPYTSTSQYFRDLIAPHPLPPVKLRIDPKEVSDNPGLSTYSFSTFGGHIRSIPYEIGLMAGTIAAVGIAGWHWGDSKFHVTNEGWFGKNTKNGGIDKLGHFYSTYLIADLLADRIRANAGNPAGAEITAAAIAFGLMAGVEVLDGYTKKYGFSKEDLAANALGAVFAITRAWVPGMREKVDFRLLYTPSYMERPGVGAKNWLIPPYRRSRYILAIKGSGFQNLRGTPLQYLELHLGYDARGFHPQEKALGYPKERAFYVGVGLNVSELLFGDGPVPNLARYRNTEQAWMAQKFLEYYQLPYTSHYNARR